MTPYYSDASTTIYLGDCREIMSTLDDLELSLVLADPPYGDTALEWDSWQQGWIAALPMTPQVWCFGSMRMFLNHADEFARYGRYAQEVVWEKHNGSGFAADRFRRVHEFAMHWYRGQWGELTINPQRVVRPHGIDKSRTGQRNAPHLNNSGPIAYMDDGTRLMRSVLTMNPPRDTLHPTQKPIGILAPLIAYSTNPGDLILDPFAGSCSTARAARSLGRRSICIEANEAYLEAAVKALAQGDLFEVSA